MERFAVGLAQAARLLLRNPGSSLMVVLLLALGVGVNTAIYSAIDTVLLAPPHYAEPDRLVNVERAEADRTRPPQAWTLVWTYAQFERLRDWTSTPLERVAAYGTTAVNVTGLAEPEQITVEFVSREYFETLGIAPVLGPGFMRTPGEPEIVLTHGWWTRRLNGAADVLAQAVTVNGRPVPVAGVMPPRFRGESAAADAFLPVDAAPAITGDASLLAPFAAWMRVVGRLPAGVDPGAAEARLASIDAGWEETGAVPVAPLQGGRLTVAPIRGSRIDPAVRHALLLVGGAALVVLLIACLNLSSLMLARAVRREREFAIRRALGGSRAQVAGQLVTESLLLSLAGGALGLLLAHWLIDALALLAPAPTPGFWANYARAVDFGALRVDGRALTFGLVVATLSGLVIALLPALRAGGPAARDALRQGSATSDGPQRSGRAALVVLQTALALMLLTGAGLLLRSLQQLHAEDLGFARHDVITAELQLPRSSYDAARVRQFYAALHERLRGEPGVISASVSTAVPFAGGMWTGDVTAAGRPAPPREERPTYTLQTATPGYLRTIGIPLLAGRDFADGESAPVVLLNRAAARALWPDRSALGEFVVLGFPIAERTTAQVVGIVEDAQYVGVGEPVEPLVYVPPALLQPRHAFVAVRTATGGAAAFGERVRTHVRELDPDLPIVELRTLEQHIGRATSRARFAAVLLTGFAALAAVLAALGVYAVLAQIVAEAGREIGVRMALGGSPRSVLALFLRRGALLTASGLGLGMLGSAAGVRLLALQLYGVQPLDRVTWITAIAGLALMGLLATALPALRAARTDPASAVRQA